MCPSFRGRLLKVIFRKHPKNTPRLPEFKHSSPLVVVELKLKAPTRLERVKVEGPGLLSTATTLLVLRVQWILARVKLLPHF